MGAEIVEVRDPSNFQETFDKLTQEQGFVVVIITGGEDPETGKNWCGDCERAKPNIKEHVLG